jgi:hypothetical protein
LAGGTGIAGDKVKEARRAAEPEARSAWSKTRKRVREFFTSRFD